MATNNGFDATKFAQFQQFQQQFPQFMKQLTLQPNTLQKYISPNPNILNEKADSEVKKPPSTKSVKKPKKPKKPKKIKPVNPFINFTSKTDKIFAKKEINILVIGETGVGKSTWINGIANYMSFNTFDDALEAKKPICLIPMNFNLYVGEKFEKVNVNMKPTVGERDQNEAEASTGQSCTQEPKVYRYITDTVAFNLIDTPGIGDTRGIEYDMENMKMVLKCLSNWKQIHGICILLKPNVPRLTLSLRYCIEELLVNLHKNSIPNISVVFTNSCNTLYRPGDTMTVLKKLFEDVKNSSQNTIHLSGANTFCIDNEAVRLLYAHQKGAEFEKDHIRNFSKSWNHTVNETHRLFKYIKGLIPHLANETKATTQIRGMFDIFSKIVAEINDEILQNRKGLENQNKQLKALTSNLQEMRKQSSYEALCIENTDQTYPITVCCGPNCIETIRIPNSEKEETFYKKICCDQCPLRNVTRSQIGEPNLRKCTAFASNGFCQSCGCSWQTHLQIWYSQEKITKTLFTNAGQEEMDHLKLQIDAKTTYIGQNQKCLDKIQEKYRISADRSRPFFKFLVQNSIIPLNSALEEYLKLSIEELEKVLKPEDDRNEIEILRKLLSIHQIQKLIASEDAKNSEDSVNLLNFAEEILKLEASEVIGPQLKDNIAYQKLFETMQPKVVEVSTKIEKPDDEVMEIQSERKKKKLMTATSDALLQN